MKKSARGPLIYILGFLIVVLLLTWLTTTPQADTSEVSYKDFLGLVRDGKIDKVTIVSHDLYALANQTQIDPKAFPDQYDYYTYVTDIEQFNDDIKEITGAKDSTGYPFDLTYQPEPQPSILDYIWPYLIPIELLGILFYFMIR